MFTEVSLLSPVSILIREGHSAPPLCINYHGSRGEHILSAGEDASLRVFSTVSETLNKSLGKASYNRKASKKRSKTCAVAVAEVLLL